MNQLSKDQMEFALAFLTRLVTSRDLKQPQLEHLSGVGQSTISKILNRKQEPTVDNLQKLFGALGLKLTDILHETEIVESELLGYLASPLTLVAKDPAKDCELRRVVSEIKAVALSHEFVLPQFNLYWPGDFTHPLRNPEFSSQQVYITDRSRASTFDFVILFCADPSYGVGQENEIATQAGLPAIRLFPDVGISRMMGGSFLKAQDIQYSGSLESKITFDDEALREALRSVRRTYFSHRALYRGMNGNDFGRRLRALVDDRSGDYQTFADDLGVDLHYLHCLIEEPFAMSNPSAKILKRLAVLLNISVGYLLGETVEVDPVFGGEQCFLAFLGSEHARLGCFGYTRTQGGVQRPPPPKSHSTIPGFPPQYSDGHERG